jgi:hypothetical protein
METVKITLNLPKDVVEEASEFGMLEPDEIAQVLRTELDRRIMAFVDAEVKAHRAEQRESDET